VAREGFLKDKCGPRAKKFEHHWSKQHYFLAFSTSSCLFYCEKGDVL